MAKKKKKKKKKDQLEDTIDEIKKKFGDGAIMRFKDVRAANVDAISTGALSLDLALGVGGVPRGRVIEIDGPESSGKTTLALHVVAEAQKEGGVAAYVDAEHALDPDYGKKIGVNVDDLLISQPNSGEQALQIVETLVRSGEVDVIVIDSVAALVPQTEVEGEMSDQQVGLQARLMSKALRKLSGITSKTGTSIIFLNQIRMKVGVFFGNPETTSGGLALKFFSSVRIELRRSAKIKQDDKIVGSRIKAKVVKNKVAPPFKKTEFDIYYNKGISKLSDIIDTALKLEVLDRAGSWYNYGNKKLGQGKKKAKKFLYENDDVRKEIQEKIKEKAQEEIEDRRKEDEES